MDAETRRFHVPPRYISNVSMSAAPISTVEEPAVVFDPERLGLPSASGMERFVNCAGSHEAERGMPPLPKQLTTDQGTAIHEAAASGDDSALDEEELPIAERLARLEQQAVRDWGNAHGDAVTFFERTAERRLWIRDRKTMDLIASAQLDVYYIAGPYALVIDMKTGYKKTTPSERNWQLLTQAIALWHEYPQLAEFRVAIAASRLSSKLDLAVYDAFELATAENAIHAAIWRSKQPNPPRNPGTWCDYCRARANCAAYASWSSVALHSVRHDGSPLGILEAVQSLSSAQCADIYRRVPMAKALFGHIEARLATLPDEELAKIGLVRKPGANVRCITDAGKAREKLLTLLAAPILDGCTSIGLGAVQKALAQAHSLKPKEARKLADETLSDLITVVQNKPSLEIIT